MNAIQCHPHARALRWQSALCHQIFERLLNRWAAKLAGLGRKTGHVKRLKCAAAIVGVLDGSRPYGAEDVAHDLLKIRFAFERLCDGSADKDDFNRVSVALNMGRYRAADIDDGLDKELAKAAKAMMRCKQRFIDTGAFGFSRTDTDQVRYALDIEAAIAEKSSPKQMEKAMFAMHAAIVLQQAKGEALPVFAEELTEKRAAT